MSALKNIAHLRSDITFGSWLSGIAVYLCLEKLREDKTSSNKINEKKLKSIYAGTFEFEIISLPVKERLVFVLHDLEKYTDEETADLIMIKTQEMKELLKHAYNLLRSANSSLSQVTPLQERINSLTNQVHPGSEIWKSLSLEIQNLKARSSIKENESDTSPEEETIKGKQEKEKKFNIFGWKRK